jgi:hypothetical protein
MLYFDVVFLIPGECKTPQCSRKNGPPAISKKLFLWVFPKFWRYLSKIVWMFHASQPKEVLSHQVKFIQIDVIVWRRMKIRQKNKFSKEFCPLGCNTMQFGERRLAFRRNISHASSGSTDKPSKKTFS